RATIRAKERCLGIGEWNGAEPRRLSLVEQLIKFGAVKIPFRIQRQPMRASFVERSQLTLSVNLPDESGKLRTRPDGTCHENVAALVHDDAARRMSKRGELSGDELHRNDDQPQARSRDGNARKA